MIVEQTKKLYKRLNILVNASPWQDQYANIISEYVKTLEQPCRLAVTGRVKAGKSSLINVLLGADLAKVGITETTATINIFKYGEPKDLEKPVLCEYLDGQKEWVSKNHLDNLQGNSKEIVEQISKVKNLTYFVKNKCLENTILIDTPGIDAVVGEDGDAHQEQTELFLGLRKQHENETIELSNNADAVILLLGDVIHESDKDFIDSFLRNRGHSSCLNTIGILSQIDLTDERVVNRKENAQARYNSLSEYVSCVLPVSAGIKRFLPDIEHGKQIKEILSSVPNKELLNGVLLRSEKMYLMPTIPGIDISLEKRKMIYQQGVIPFRCFAVIAKVLYENELEDAIRLLNDISGIDVLRDLLDAYFFKRSHQIKCEIAIRQALLIIWEILNCGRMQRQFQKDELNSVAVSLTEIQRGFEDLLSQVESANADFQCFTVVAENNQLFSKEEYEELKILFSNQKLEFDNEKMNYWYSLSNNSSNEQIREIARRAYFKYNDLAFI